MRDYKLFISVINSNTHIRLYKKTENRDKNSRTFEKSKIAATSLVPLVSVVAALSTLSRRCGEGAGMAAGGDAGDVLGPALSSTDLIFSNHLEKSGVKFPN